MKNIGLAAAMLLLTASTTAAWAQSGAAFDAVKRDLVRAGGGGARAAANLAKCKDQTGAPGPDITGLQSFDAVNVTGKFIAMSSVHPFEDPGGQLVAEYVRLRAFPDDHVEITLKRVKAATLEGLGPERTLRCDLTDGSVSIHARE